MRDHANNCHLQLLITSEEKAEVREMNAALSTAAQKSGAPVMELSGDVNFNNMFEEADGRKGHMFASSYHNTLKNTLSQHCRV